LRKRPWWPRPSHLGGVAAGESSAELVSPEKTSDNLTTQMGPFRALLVALFYERVERVQD